MAEAQAADQSQLIIGVALTGSSKSKYILRWALENFLPEGNVSFKFLHVYPKINVVPTGPTPMGIWLPVVQDPVDFENGYRRETERQKLKKLVPYQQSLEADKIKADIVLLESDDIAKAISLETSRQAIRHLVIGVSSSASFFSMRSLSLMRADDLSRAISENAPSICSVYVIGDGKLQQLRPASSEQNVITMDDTSHLLKNKPTSPRNGSTTAASDFSTSTSEPKHPEFPPKHTARTKTLVRETLERRQYTFKDINLKFGNASTQSQSSSSGDSGSWVSDRTSPGCSLLGTQSDGPSPIGTLHTGGAFATTSTTACFMNTPPAGTPPMSSYMATHPAGSPAGTPPGGSYVGTSARTPPEGSDVGIPPSSYALTPPSVSFLNIPSDSKRGASSNQIAELEKLRIELRHIEKMYELTHNSCIDERLNEPSKERLGEALKLKEGKSKEIESIEKTQLLSEAIDPGRIAERNKPRNKANTKDTQEVEESKNKLKELFVSPAVQYQKFTWEEIMEATSSLSNEFIIGMGAFGTVYKCKLHHTTVAIKVLHSKDSVTNKQFVQEVEILSTIRHPHLLLLLGAVPEESCLIYEYMDQGSLDDRLFRKTNKPPLPWYDRFRICNEVASALAFLHSTKPRPIIHRDLKPANILLDHHLVSKIGDAGLGTMINIEPNNQSLKTIYKETSPVGTLCYIDPEYQRAGRVSTKSDIYALGVVILQLLTAKPAVGIAYMIEDAIDEGTLTELLDPEAGEWPEKETLELALIGLQCSELRGRDRPDLREKVLPALEIFKEVADRARELASNALTATPAHFMCLILKDFMEDPYVAADGYTYDRKAIEKWLMESDMSPTTNQPLPHKFIMPNTSLLEAIKQWKSKKSSN